MRTIRGLKWLALAPMAVFVVACSRDKKPALDDALKNDLALASQIPPSPDQAPIARARSAGRKPDSTIARLPGVRRAPPTPCTSLATTSSSAFGATAQSSEAIVNRPVPDTKMRRRP